MGVDSFLRLLKSLGFDHLDESAERYQEGLALGTAEITLLELAQAYDTLANNGIQIPYD